MIIFDQISLVEHKLTISHEFWPFMSHTQTHTHTHTLTQVLAIHVANTNTQTHTHTHTQFATLLRAHNGVIVTYMYFFGRHPGHDRNTAQ